jgi:hypothetical protein
VLVIFNCFEVDATSLTRAGPIVRKLQTGYKPSKLKLFSAHKVKEGKRQKIIKNILNNK